MVKQQDIIYVPLSFEQFLIVEKEAKKLELGGKSAIRDNRQDRMRNIRNDQIIGQCGEMALSLYLTGKIDKYIERRNELNKTLWKGDGGSDFPNLKVDIKSSRKNDRLDYLDHNFLLKPKEYHLDTVYIQSLVKVTGVTALVVLVGWIKACMLPPKPREEGMFSGSYVVPCYDLNPLPPLLWVFDESNN